jgi:hypothetical protein
MGKKKNTSTSNTSLPAIRLGTRVRCTDDGVEGRIAWANALSVKIKWDDGEEVTWKRAELATKPIEFLDAEPVEQPAVQAEPAADEPAPEQPAEADVSATESATPALGEEPTAPEAPITELLVVPTAAEPAESQPATDGAPAPTAGPAPKRQRKPKPPAASKEKKMSAIDAAAKVLAEAGTPMTQGRRRDLHPRLRGGDRPVPGDLRTGRRHAEDQLRPGKGTPDGHDLHRGEQEPADGVQAAEMTGATGCDRFADACLHSVW